MCIWGRLLLYFHLYKYFGCILNTFSMYSLQFRQLRASCYRQNHETTEDGRNLVLASVNRYSAWLLWSSWLEWGQTDWSWGKQSESGWKDKGLSSGLFLISRLMLAWYTTGFHNIVSYCSFLHKVYWNLSRPLCHPKLPVSTGMEFLILLSPLCLQDELEQEPGYHQSL